MAFRPWKALEPAGLTAWRITSARFASRPFDGEGARLFGGRWNHPGTSLVYASETLSLSALEFFVHLDPSLAPRGLVMAAAEIPPGLPLQGIDVSMLRGDWRSYPAPDGIKEIGTAWVRSGEGAVLLVPSCVIPVERNVLLNPAHSDFGRIRFLPAEPFAFDPRMWK